MKKFNIWGLAFGFAALSMLASCKKDSNVAPAEGNAVAKGIAVNPVTSTPQPFVEPSTKGTIAVVSGVYNVRNFHQGTVPDLVDTTKWATRSGTYYYDLGNDDGGTSSNYDFKFQGTATGDFVVNTTKYDLYYVDAAFSTVNDETGGTLVSSGTLGINSGNPGWYNYILATHQVTAVANRTIVLVDKTTGLATYKIRINSIYWDATPVGTPATNYPFYSLDYEELL